MSNWQLPHTVPKDGTIVLTYFDRGIPVFAAWFPAQAEEFHVRKRLFRKPVKVVTRKAQPAGLRVLIPTREGTFAVHGNYGVFRGDGWMPVPDYPVFRVDWEAIEGRRKPPVDAKSE